MKAIETPRSGKIGDKVAYVSPYGQCYHAYVVPRDPKTQARTHVRVSFGVSSQRWRDGLTEDQRLLWVKAAQIVPSHPSLGEYAHLSGQLLWVKIDNTLRLIGRQPVLEPPAPVIFGPQPVADLVAITDEAGTARLMLNVTAATEDVMVFGQAPCSRGRMKPRRLYYLGLFRPANTGQYDITPIYTARFVAPSPGEKVFVLTCQHQNGWKGPEHLTSAILQPQPASSQA
jgi:hypothetical protein